MLTILKVAVAQIDVLETMTPRQFTGFRDSAGGGERVPVGAVPRAGGGARTARRGRARRPLPPAVAAPTASRRRWHGPSLFDAFLVYLVGHGYAVPAVALQRDVTQPPAPTPGLDEVLLAVYADDGGPAQVCERLVDLDEGLQEWRYRHVKMVERTIGDKSGTGGSSGAAYLRSTLFTPLFPDLWAVRGQL